MHISMTHTFWVLELRITVYPCIADFAISGVENTCKLTGFERAWHSSNEDGLPWINGLGVVHDVITVRQLPGTNLYLQREKKRKRESVCKQHFNESLLAGQVDAKAYQSLAPQGFIHDFRQGGVAKTKIAELRGRGLL